MPEVEYPPVEWPAPVPPREADSTPPVMTSAPGEPGPLPHEKELEPNTQASAIIDPSAATLPPSASPPQCIELPTFSGVSKVGELLEATSYGVWTHNDPQIQLSPLDPFWLFADAEGNPLELASFNGGEPYVPSGEDIGKYIVLAVSATTMYGITVVVSAPSGIIAA